MKHIFNINLFGLFVLAAVWIWEPVLGAMGLFPYGVLQVILNIIVLSKTKHTRIRNLGKAHVIGTLMIALFALILSQSAMIPLLYFSIGLSFLLLVLSLYSSCKQQQISKK